MLPALLLLLSALPQDPLPAQGVGLWIALESPDRDHRVLLASKDWEAGEVVDRTSNHDLGSSRASASAPGWALWLQPSGAWALALGDGERSVEYRASPVQRIDDGGLHHLAFLHHAADRTVHLYRDGRRVAILSTAELGAWPAEFDGPSWAVARTAEGGPATTFEVVTYGDRAGAPDPGAVWRARTGEPAPTVPAASESLRVLAWNIWHGGRRDGREEGLAKTVDVIRASGADLVLMQETYGSGPELADRLGFELYLRSSNLSVLSRFPIVATHDVYRPFYLGGATVDAGAGRRVEAYSLWIRYHDDFGEYVRTPGRTAAELVEWSAPRARAIGEVLEALAPALERSRRHPVLLGGDFNGPSHLDWTEATRERHAGHGAVLWPVTSALAGAGLVDAYRTVHPDPRSHPGHTWSPRFPDTWQDRIDHVYSAGDRLVPVAAEVLREHPRGWPSDHAAVLVEYAWRGH